MQTKTKNINYPNLISLVKPKKLEGFTLPERREIPVQLIQVKQFRKLSDRAPTAGLSYPEL